MLRSRAREICSGKSARVRSGEFELEEILPLVTANAAAALKLADKGIIKAGNSADILVLEKETLKIREVVSGGKRLLTDGKIAFKEKFLKDSNRDIRLKGEKTS